MLKSMTKCLRPATPAPDFSSGFTLEAVPEIGYCRKVAHKHKFVDIYPCTLLLISPDLYLLHAGFAVSNQPHFEALNPDRQFVDQLGREEWHQRLVVCVYFENLTMSRSDQ